MQAASNQRRTERLRAAAIRAYGGKCVGCGESDSDVLQFDHVDGDGAEHRSAIKQTGRAFYRWLEKQGWPSMFQLLCANCHARKSRREWRRRWGFK